AALPAIGDGGSNPAVTTGDFDAGGTADDVQVQFSTPDFGTVNSFQIQRADAKGVGSTSCSATDVPSANYTTIGTVSPAGTQGNFIDFDRAVGKTFCYRVRVQDPVTAAENFSVVSTTTIGGGAGDVTKPTSLSTSMTPSSSGLANTLDTGDKVGIAFSESMSVSPTAVIRVTDSDCGTAQNSGPATCSGGTSNTVADIICGNNANCVLNPTNQLVVTMTSNPSVVAAGSVTGAQFPLVVTDR